MKAMKLDPTPLRRRRAGLRSMPVLVLIAHLFFFAAGGLILRASLLFLLVTSRPSPFGHFNLLARAAFVADVVHDDGPSVIIGDVDADADADADAPRADANGNNGEGRSSIVADTATTTAAAGSLGSGEREAASISSSPDEERARIHRDRGRRHLVAHGHEDDGGRGERSVVVNSTTLRGKVMAGYQGWFRTPGGDGPDDEDQWSWRHWMKDGHGQHARPNASNVDIEMWPDLREFEHSELTDTDFVYPDGSNAGLYDARDYESVRRHVGWMAEYGIDGCFVQRFLSDVLDDRDGRDVVLNHVMKTSEEYGRVFANMYDISGYGRHPERNSRSIVQMIREDWIHLVDDLNVTGSSQYLRHDDRPVLAIWGFGLSDRGGDASPTEAMELIHWLSSDPNTPEKYRVTLMGGVDGKFRSHPNFDSWRTVYGSLDVVSPWTVGRYRDVNEADSYLEDHTRPDVEWSTGHGMEYMPVVYPGYSFYHDRHDERRYDEIPRARGSFFWRQVCNVIVAAGVDMLYIAMFDEVNEGTAIYKVAEDSSMTPTTGRFVTLNEDDGRGVGGAGGGDENNFGERDGDVVPEKLPSDWYLRLAGEAGRLLRGEAGATGRYETACRALVPPPLLGGALLPPPPPPKSSYLNG